ncbi:RNA polymerase sigma factor [Carboxylicivirga sp. A043]|uniref:RNA polymerase sigma factor n=1 Tax=Carboxylicivirga litoralis TaxID=2816963 RepID=UPI0021CB5915|nr:RNA polymerase sigma factor [Carboxylicivirga sp. A043]MCU4155510.1 RNA polymerase sigma factor [Carboxylicivirga sp. A043]
MKKLDINKKNDEVLIEELKQGNSTAYEQLYNRYYLKVFNKCYSFARNTDDAFDLCQDIFMKTFAALSSFKGHSKFSTWLYSITYNHCVSTLKKEKQVHYESLEEKIIWGVEMSSHEDVEDQVARENREQELLKALNDIPHQDKQILELKYLSNFSVKEIQTELNISKSAVKMRLMRARQKVGKSCEYAY